MARLETRSWDGSGAGRVNEDFACVSEQARCAVLVDGATGLGKVNLIVGTSDAAWYARSLAEGTVAAYAHGRGLAEALSAAGQAVAERYLALPGARELGRAEIPNGSVAAVCWDDERVELCMLGDCTAAVLMADGLCEVVHDATLDALDAANYQRMYRFAREMGTTMAEARAALNDCFVANRRLLNAPGGYVAADVTCKGFGHEVVRRFAAADVDHVVMCTDGFASAVEMGVAPSPVELARQVSCGKGAELGEALRAAERADAGCWAHPRSKTSDDATYVWVAL